MTLLSTSLIVCLKVFLSGIELVGALEERISSPPPRVTGPWVLLVNVDSSVECVEGLEELEGLEWLDWSNFEANTFTGFPPFEEAL